MNAKSDEASGQPQSRGAARPRALALGCLAGLGAALVLLVLAIAWSARDPLPRLTDETLAAAMSRWDEFGPRNYDLDLVLSGAQTGNIHIEVRDGEVTNMTRDGHTPVQRRTWDFWSVPNQMAMIAEDLSSAEGDPQRAFGVSDRGQVVLQAEFDPQLGYPRRYRRQVLGTTTNTIEWRVTRFTPR
ncbi:MAG: DUF6174 domain-containing protein [Pirellulales bacterium]